MVVLLVVPHAFTSDDARMHIPLQRTNFVAEGVDREDKHAVRHPHTRAP